MVKDQHAVALGRKGGKATALKLTKEERIANARHAANQRWERIRTAKQVESCQPVEK
jgi:hypothetical protein